MITKVFSLAILSMSMLLTSLGVYAANDAANDVAKYVDHPQLPDKAVSRFVTPLLQALNAGSKQSLEQFMDQHVDPLMIPAEMRGEYIDYLLNQCATFGELSFHSSRDYKDKLPQDQLVIIVRAAQTESWQAISLGGSGQGGNGLRLSLLDIGPAHRPANLAVPKALSEREVVKEIAAYTQRMADNDVFSGAVLVAHQDRILFSSAYGQASKRFQIANQLDTKFNIASMSKMFTGVAIAQLVEGGKLAFDDKLSHYLDDSWLAPEVSREIKIHHLLTHTSGLGNFLATDELMKGGASSRFKFLEDYKPLVKDETLAFEPGSEQRYSNTGMLLLGAVIEQVSGMSYFDYVQKHIYEPANMHHSDSFEMDQPVVNLAIGYERSRDTPSGWRNNLYTNTFKGSPAGGSYSTVGDLHKFARALTNNQLVTPALTRQLLSPKPDVHSQFYGYGFNVSGFEGESASSNRVVGHNGGHYGIETQLEIYLDRGYIVTSLSNYGSGASSVNTKIGELLARITTQP